MYKYRGYDSSLTRNAGVKQNGTMGRHTSPSPPPVIGDGKRRPIRDRLQNITSAMSWIKEELEDIKEQDKTLISIFQKVQGDVKELNGFVSGRRSSSSLPGTPAAPIVQPRTIESSLELDFDALDDDLSEDGELKNGSLSITPSPPLGRVRGLTGNVNVDSSLDSGSRDNLTATPNHVQSRNGVSNVTENGIAGSADKEVSPDSTSGTLSISLGSLDLDFSMTSFGLGTINEGRSLINIPMTTSTSSSSHSSTNGDSPAASKDRASALQRSVSQQPLQNPGVAEKGRKLSYQPPKKEPPQTLPKPRRYSTANHQAPPSSQKRSVPNHQPPVIAMVSRQSSEMSERISPQQARKEMMKSTPALFSSPPRARKNMDSVPRYSSTLMTPLLPFQAQQELRDAAKQIKQDSKKASNGIIPQLQQGSPILLRRPSPGAPHKKQPSPPLPYASTKRSPKHVPQQISPTSSRMYSHLAPGMKGSLSMSKLSPSVSRAQEETLSTISRNSSIDSGIQYSSEGENGGGVTSEGVSNASTASSGAGVAATSDSVSNTSTVSSGVGEGGQEGAKKLTGDEKSNSDTLGDFSDILSAIANMGGGDSWFS